VRYADGGGCGPGERARREALRFDAAALFEQGLGPGEVAERLRVSRNSAYKWRRAWRESGIAALPSRGPGGFPCRLDADRRERLCADLEAGPAVHGFGPDQRWTGARVADLIARRFHVRYTVRGATYLLHRLGYSPQVPAHRAVERDDEAIAAWRVETWSQIKG
jgi:putative transposase